MPKNFHKLLLVCSVTIFSLFSQISNSEELSSKAFELTLEKLETYFNQRNADFINEYIDFDSILEQSFKHIETDPAFKNGFYQGYKKQARQKLVQQFFGNMPDDARVKLIKKSIHQNRAEGIYRFDFGDNGYGYTRFMLEDRGQSKIKIVDWFDYARGQRYTDSLGLLIRSITPGEGFIGKIKDLISEKSRDSKLLLEFVKLLNNKDYSGIKLLFENNKNGFRNNWNLSSSLVNAANMSNDEIFYKEVLDFVSINFANDERAGFLLIDYYFYQKDIDKVITLLDQFSSKFDHQDSGVFYLKSSFYIEMKEYEKAREAALKSIKVEADFEDGYWSLVTISIAQKNFSQAIIHFNQLEDIFGYEFSKDAFESEGFYQDFIQSVEYQNWLG